MSVAAINKLITKEKPVSKDFKGNIILVYGDKKVGKSTFASRFDNPLFLDCEQGLRTVGKDDFIPDHIEVHEWDRLEQTVDALHEDLMGYDTLVVDGLNEAWSYLVDKIVTEAGAKDINDGELGYGKGMARAVKTFRNWFQKLRRLNITIVLCAHDRVINVEHNGVSYDKRIPYVDDSKDGKAWNAIKPAINMVLYAYKEQGKDGVIHVMRTKGNQLVEAADPHGKMPEVMPFSYPALEKVYSA